MLKFTEASHVCSLIIPRSVSSVRAWADPEFNKEARSGFLLFCLTFRTQVYNFFIGRLEEQYPHEANCAPVHFTSLARTGAPQCGQVPGKRSMRWDGCAGAGGGVIGMGIGMGLGSRGGVGGFCGHCGVAALKNPSKRMLNPTRMRMPGHQCPQKNRMANPTSQKALRKDLHGR